MPSGSASVGPLGRIQSRWAYYRRVFSAYVLGGTSQLTFWYDTPQVNEEAPVGRLGQYHMPFLEKAAYSGPFDPQDVPLLDYRGSLGRQYNPIAIAQFGLGNYNLHCRTGSEDALKKWTIAADWLVDHLESNPQSVPVWNHHFDFEYRDTLRAPWYSALAQGQGLSMLVRAHQQTNDTRYLDTASRAFEAFLLSPDVGGVTWEWPDGDIWFEEYMVHPPTHILNGFIWAMWGVYDYSLATGDERATDLFARSAVSLGRRLSHYEWGRWSLYELSGTRMRMLASPFYHRLHIAQLRATQRLVGGTALGEYADRWERYSRNPWYSKRALAYKALFKLLYY